MDEESKAPHQIPKIQLRNSLPQLISRERNCPIKTAWKLLAATERKHQTEEETPTTRLKPCGLLYINISCENFVHTAKESVHRLPICSALFADSPKNEVETIMPPELALEYEQDQRCSRWTDIDAERDYQELKAAMHQALQASGRFGQGKLCKCLMKCAEDCDCSPF
jgi:hypothetical protein